MWSFEGAGAMGRHRAGEEDRKARGQGHQDLKEVRELPRWFPAQELPGQRAQQESGPNGRSAMFKVHRGQSHRSMRHGAEN